MNVSTNITILAMIGFEWRRGVMCFHVRTQIFDRKSLLIKANVSQKPLNFFGSLIQVSIFSFRNKRTKFVFALELK